MKNLIYFNGESESYSIDTLKYHENQLLFPLGGGQMLKVLSFGFAVDGNGYLFLRAKCEDGKIRLLKLFNADYITLGSWAYHMNHAQ